MKEVEQNNLDSIKGAETFMKMAEEVASREKPNSISEEQGLSTVIDNEPTEYEDDIE